VNYRLHPGAERDIADVLDFYTEQAGPLVAQRFLKEFERVAALLVQHPASGAPTVGERRVFPLRVFPNSIIYSYLDTGLRIIVIRHQHRKPGFGGARR
jgi:toxin ParE1/3/4